MLNAFIASIISIQLYQFSSVTQLCPTLCDPMDAACQASLSITNPQSLLKLMSIESMMPSNHLILCRPFLLLPSIFPSIRVFSNESDLCIRWLKYWNFSFSSSPSNEYLGTISFRIDWFESIFSLFKIFYKQAICMVSFRKHYLISSLFKRVKSFIEKLFNLCKS